MNRKITLGSLFDGIGGFPLSGVMCGVEPAWASEIEPFPIAVTMSRFPNMKHLGSVTDIKGDQIEPVDIITFGSPCQDLSVAGKQAGIHDGVRSNLFFEAVRIIKEMREHDRAIGRTGKYYLSPKACLGILRRAERRGKELPKMLKDALEEVVAMA